jgi:Uncharacterised protein family (UPF0158)
MEEIIKEIIRLLQIDEVVFLHRETQEIHAYPAPDRSGYNEFDYLEEEVLEIVNANPEMYIRFDPPDSNEGYQIMESFVEMLNNERLKVLLSDALQSKKPFRNFRVVLQNNHAEQDWYDFRDAYLKMGVRDKL